MIFAETIDETRSNLTHNLVLHLFFIATNSHLTSVPNERKKSAHRLIRQLLITFVLIFFPLLYLFFFFSIFVSALRQTQHQRQQAIFNEWKERKKKSQPNDCTYTIFKCQFRLWINSKSIHIYYFEKCLCVCVRAHTQCSSGSKMKR